MARSKCERSKRVDLQAFAKDLGGVLVPEVFALVSLNQRVEVVERFARQSAAQEGAVSLS